MATLAPDSPTSSPRRRRKGCARRCERYCWNTITYFPLVFVYGLSTWAVWVETQMAWSQKTTSGYFMTYLGCLLYALLNWSYTAAVFTDPGSPMTTSPGYTSLPTSEPASFESLTVKSTGGMRYCKKCQCKKPDRTHHCSTCQRCVLKMDHHCPWLATCVGMKNYKAFLLFLIYTTVFCWACFAVSAKWIWDTIVVDGTIEEDSLMPVNFIILSVLSGIIGLVIGGFTAWHVYLTLKGKTTIESLESTKYLSPLRQQMSSHIHQQRTYVDHEDRSLTEHIRNIGDAIVESHANALPGVLRAEEGEERLSPAASSLRRAYDWDAAERQRERERYLSYLDETYSEKLPNAFDLGYKTNWRQVMGPSPLLWWLPLCNAMGDGWTWEVSRKWREATEMIKQRKEEEMRRNGLVVPAVQHNGGPIPMYSPNAPISSKRSSPRPHDSSWAAPDYSSGLSTPLQNLSTSRRGSTGEEEYDTSSDEESLADARARLLRNKTSKTENWNDLPDDMVAGGPRRGRKSK